MCGVVRDKTAKRNLERHHRTALYNNARLQSLLNSEIRLRRNNVMQPPDREAPRLTGYLRAHGGISSDVSREHVFVDERFIRRKQKIQRASSSPERKWSDVKGEITERCSRSEVQKVGLLERVIWSSE